MSCYKQYTEDWYSLIEIFLSRRRKCRIRPPEALKGLRVPGFWVCQMTRPTIWTRSNAKGSSEALVSLLDLALRNAR